MKKGILFAIPFIALLLTTQVFANKDETINVFVKDKIIQSGSFDLYDASTNKVRNLRPFDDAQPAVETETGFTQTYRDIATGDIVTLQFLLEEEVVKKATIIEIKTYVAVEPVKTEYTDEEIVSFVTDYVDQQSKFSGTMTFYDEEKQVLRKLKLVDVANTVKRFGSLNIVRVHFEDDPSGDKLGIDVQIANQAGMLNIKNLFVRERK